ncbi:unnamed protein product [Urochloa humidicola]
MAGGGGRLSGLPDNLLRRILSFAPAKEGASTAVLSRRWRSLWRTSGAVTIDSRSYPFMTPGDIEAALATTAEGPVIRKLTLHVEEHIIGTNLRIRSYSGHESKSMLAAFLSGPAAAAAGAGLEELRVVVTDGRHDYGNQAEFNFDDLPSPESLRVLHVFNCSTLTVPPPAAAFSLPRLTELRLQRCGVSLINLQRIVEAAPQLATLHLECYYYVSTCGILDGSQIGVEGPSYRIHCPAVTVLVFKACSPLWPWKEGGLELDVPKLQYFRYKGLVHLQNRLLLKLSASSANVIRTDLHFVQQKYMGEQDRVRFWEFVQSFNATKVMKMKVDFSADQVAMDEKGELLGYRLFYNLERLDLEVACEPATVSYL